MTIVLARAADCQIERRIETVRGRVRSVAASSSVLLGAGAENVSTWATGDFRVSHVVRAHPKQVTALVALPDGGWASGGTDGDLATGSHGGSRRLGQLADLPDRILALPGGAAVLTVDTNGDTKLVPLDGAGPRQLFAAGADLYAAALRPGTPEVVVGGKPGLHKVLLPRGTEAAVGSVVRPGASTTALAYSADGARLAEGNTDGDVVLRDPDTGAIDQRLAGLRSQVNGLVFTATDLWAGGDDQKLLRWPLAGGATPDVEIPEDSPIQDLAITSDGRYLIAGLDDGAMVHALPDGAPVARLIPFYDRSWATLYADGHYVASAGAALSLRIENPTTRQVATLGEPFEPAAIGTPAATRLASGHTRLHATVFSPSGPPRVRLDDTWDLVSLTPSGANLAAYDVDIVLEESSARAHHLTVVPPEGAAVRRDSALPSATGAADLSSARPRDPDATTPLAPVTAPGATAGAGIARLSAAVTRRQPSVTGTPGRHRGEARTLEIEATLSEDAAWIRVAVYSFAEPKRAAIELLAPSLDSPLFKKGTSVPLAIPLREGLEAGRYHVQIQPCAPGSACGAQAAATFDVEL